MMRPLVEWAVGERTAFGQTESGDAYIVKIIPDGILVGVFDGLGHGEEAALASRIAASTTNENTSNTLMSIFKSCHTKLFNTRGVVMSLARISANDGTMTWAGVGNVEGRLLRADASVTPQREVLLLRGGVVGAQLPLLYMGVIPIMPGDVLVFASDGIQPPFTDEVFLGDPVQKIVDGIVSRRGKATDDVLALAVRYLGRDLGEPSS